MNTQQKIEYKWGKRLLNHLGIPKELLRCADKPDLHLFFENKKIGIEHTDYYDDLNRKGSKSRKWLSNARKIGEVIKDQLSPIHGYHIFLEHSDKNAHAGKYDSTHIAETIKTAIKNNEEYVALDGQIFNGTDIIKTDGSCLKVQVTSGGLTSPPDIDCVQRIINDKNLLIEKYENMEKYWLLITADSFAKGNRVSILPEDHACLETLDKLGFDRVFLITIFDQYVEF